MLTLQKVKFDDERISKFESLITSCPARMNQGDHVLFLNKGKEIGYLHHIPLIWIAGDLIPVPVSHWVYVSRLAFLEPRLVANSLRLFYQSDLPFLYPLTLICKPTPGHAEEFNSRLGYSPDKWLKDYWTKHCMKKEDLPLFNRDRNRN